MRKIAPVSLTLSAIILGAALVASGQVQSPKDMQQKLDQELANTKRSASESASGTGKSAGDVSSDAERKVEDLTIQHNLKIGASHSGWGCRCSKLILGVDECLSGKRPESVYILSR